MSNMFDNIAPFLRVEIKQIRFISQESKWNETKISSEHRIWNITSGNLYIKHNNKTFTLTKGDVLLLSPGTRYSASTDENGCEFLYVHFAVRIGNNLDILSDENFAGVISKEFIGRDCLDYCEKGIKYYIENTAASFGSYVSFINYFEKIIDTIKAGNISYFDHTDTEIPTSKLWKTMSYIGSHFSEQLSVADLAERAGMSEKYFSRRFKDMLGISPKQYIMQCRMNYASNNLLSTTDSIQNIALDSGYADIYSFSKAFKKYYGESPALYRNKALKG